jgi:hypothetical protein
LIIALDVYITPSMKALFYRAFDYRYLIFYLDISVPDYSQFPMPDLQICRIIPLLIIAVRQLCRCSDLPFGHFGFPNNQNNGGCQILDSLLVALVFNR